MGGDNPMTDTTDRERLAREICARIDSPYAIADLILEKEQAERAAVVERAASHVCGLCRSGSKPVERVGGWWHESTSEWLNCNASWLRALLPTDRSALEKVRQEAKLGGLRWAREMIVAGRGDFLLPSYLLKSLDEHIAALERGEGGSND